MERWFKSEALPLQFKQEDIDRENGIIRNVVMAQAGPAKGHGVHLEESFIAALETYAHQYFSKSGNKARFDHPALSTSTMGTQMGYFHDIRKDGQRLLGDLHLLESSNLSPTKPGMREWMLSMAEEATDFVMSSIVFRPSGYYQYDPETNEPVQLDIDVFGDPIPEFQNERVYTEFDPDKGARHYYTDLVEAGAATDSLFSTQFNQDKFAVRTVAWLQDNPDILEFIRSQPHKIIEMCDKLQIPISKNMSKTKEGFFAHMAAFFSNNEPEAAPDTPAPAADPEPAPEPEPAPAAPSALETQLSAMNEQLQELAKTNAQLAEENKALREKHLAAAATVEVQPDADRRERYLCATTLKAGR